MATLMVQDESAAGKLLGRFPLEFPTEQITVRELIRERVYQEVQDRTTSAALAGGHRLVTPEQVELELNGTHRAPPKPKPIDWKKQFQIACDAFERNGFFILVGDRQVESLDEVVDITRGVEVSFVKLTPLVGG
jgi:hypothetical protein